ncbi:Nramp family divalent metal transporter [Micromonospora sp. NPDC048999]|uniref:Nramp family divalent metal transporter n=1 Tax=Micromonospora sp. NPDC048999 TaxID=3155391 RepID=UPI0033D85B12
MTTIQTQRPITRGAVAARPRVAPLLGPGFVAAIAYIDPGNVATNLTAGATSGYLLVWVVVAASLVAVLVQFQAAKLGAATGKSLPQLSRERFPRWASQALWVQAEVVVLATDVAEFVGAAIGMRLLFGMPVGLAAVVTGVLSLLMLELRRRGRTRRLELVSAAALLTVGAGFLYNLYAVGHQSATAALHGLTPRLDGTESVVLAMGIVGATVMPHAVYLHSAIVRTGGRPTEEARRSPALIRRALRIDCGAALGLATVVNVSMIALGVGLGETSGGVWTGDIVAAHSELLTRVGGAAALLFSIALLASGLSSSGVGTLAGDVVMDGFLARRIPVRVRRLVTITPAMLALLLGAPLTGLLIASQVVLSLGVPVALFLLVWFCRDRALMGSLVNAPLTTRVAATAGAAVAAVGCALPLLLLI